MTTILQARSHLNPVLINPVIDVSDPKGMDRRSRSLRGSVHTLNREAPPRSPVRELSFMEIDSTGEDRSYPDASCVEVRGSGGYACAGQALRLKIILRQVS